MANAMTSSLLAIPLLGLATGMRTMTPMAVLCWFAYLKHLAVSGTWSFWTANLVSAVVFTLLAFGEYVGDKLPFTPNRTSAGPLAARLVFGGLIGAIAATATRGPQLGGALLGALGAAAGSFAGFSVRRQLVKRIGCADWYLAVAEDFFTLFCAVFAMHVLTS